MSNSPNMGFLYYAAILGRPPGPEMEYCTDRESYSLAAGLALGMVCLGVNHCNNSCCSHVYVSITAQFLLPEWSTCLQEYSFFWAFSYLFSSNCCVTYIIFFLQHPWLFFSMAVT